jgi:aspartate kinase
VVLADAAEATELILRSGIAAPECVERNENVAKVSVVGTGMESHHGAAKAIFEAVYEENINVLMISSSELRFSLVVDREDADRTVRAIHRLFYRD